MAVVIQNILRLIFLCGLLLTASVWSACTEDCDSSQCADPAELEGAACPAGVVFDECDCCYVCANQEFQLCEHPDIRNQRQDMYLGKCGEGLQCTIRDDLGPDADPESICLCMEQEAICGTDDVTYDNLCQMSFAANEKGQDIQVKSQEPCPTAPVIIGPPEHVKDLEGNNTALICEAKGYPIPVIEWAWKRVDGKTGFLPNDDKRMAAYNRGGPEPMQVTGWLQIQDIQKEHEGDYTCIAQNTLGMDKSVARIVVEERELQGENNLPFFNKKRNRNSRNRNSKSQQNRG